MLFPGDNLNTDKQSYFLVAADGFNNSIKKISLPANLYAHEWIFSKANDTDKLKKLLLKLSKTEIQRTKDGLVIDDNDNIAINYNDAVVTSCNNNFSSEFEKFYCMLRKHGITF